MFNIDWKKLITKRFILASITFVGSTALTTLGIYFLLADESDNESNTFAFKTGDSQPIMALASLLNQSAVDGVTVGSLMTSPFVLAFQFANNNFTELSTRVVTFFDKESNYLASQGMFDWKGGCATPEILDGRYIDPKSLISYKDGFVIGWTEWEAEQTQCEFLSAKRSTAGYQYYENGKLQKEKILNAAKPNEITMPYVESIPITKSTFVSIYSVSPINPMNETFWNRYRVEATLTDSNGNTTRPTIIATDVGGIVTFPSIISSAVTGFLPVKQTAIDGKFAILTTNYKLSNDNLSNCTIFNKLEQEITFPIDIYGMDLDDTVAYRLSNGNIFMIDFMMGGVNRLLYSPDGTKIANVSVSYEIDFFPDQVQIIPINGDIVVAELDYDKSDKATYKLEAFDGTTLAPVDKKIVYQGDLDNKPYDRVGLFNAASINNGEDIYVVYPTDDNNGTLVGQTIKYDKSAHDKKHANPLISKSASIAGTVGGLFGMVASGLFAGYSLFSLRGRNEANYNVIPESESSSESIPLTP